MGIQEESLNAAITVSNVSKRFGDRLVLDGINLTVPACRIYGLRGHNGSGKSVLLRIICGLVVPTSGEVTIFGQRIGKDAEFPDNTGALIDQPGFLPHYSGLRNLQLLAMIRNVVTRKEIAETIRLVGLDPTDRRPVRTYSTGMRQRLGLAQALMESPRLLILDEPTNALDREGVKDVHRLVRELTSRGVTILLTSHSQEEIQDLCDAVFEIDRGHLSPVLDGASPDRR